MNDQPTSDLSSLIASLMSAIRWLPASRSIASAPEYPCARNLLTMRGDVGFAGPQDDIRAPFDRGPGRGGAVFHMYVGDVLLEQADGFDRRAHAVENHIGWVEIDGHIGPTNSSDITQKGLGGFLAGFHEQGLVTFAQNVGDLLDAIDYDCVTGIF